MRSCIALFYIAISCVPAAAQAPDPDAIYRERESIPRAREAVAIWKERLAAEPGDFESAWKIARAMYWIGGHDAPDRRRAALEEGVDAGRRAADLEPMRPEGHFWMAANMGALAESFGLRQGLKYRGPIKDALETVLHLDPAYLDGSADRALGRWYFKVPRLFGGSKEKSEEHLRRSLTYNPNSIASHFFLAETLFDRDRRDEALAELDTVLRLPIDAEWEPEDREFKELARARITKEGN